MQKTIDQHLDSLTKFATPIYATTHPYVPKIDHRTTSATLTFIRFKGQVWGVTCKHVAQERFEQLESRTGQWCIASGRLIQNFSYIASGEFRDSFLYPKNGSADVALCPLGHVWDFFEKEGCQAAVVLDTKELQDMLNASTQFETGIAIGFPDRAKELRIGKEGLRLIKKCTRLTGPIAPKRYSRQWIFWVLSTE
ncbi:hypothetical protein [uncultured Tateyamaria sp.]|uniref:hypothetical protein n=1 Tax=uncultured Tateyamaria sp. TaxID=455651 RepID=UPI002613F0AB|nr:hypothetical protein [uncultured Tateyamaria sp.]